MTGLLNWEEDFPCFSVYYGIVAICDADEQVQLRWFSASQWVNEQVLQLQMNLKIACQDQQTLPADDEVRVKSFQAPQPDFIQSPNSQSPALVF